MLAWHLPHQLAAELVLVGVSAAVLLYSLLPWGKNQWLRTHGVILCGYYAVGGLVYDELEGWGLLDTTYFLTVTITTVGYGDFCPETPEGKLFTVVYCLVGIIFVFAALSPLVDALMYVKELLLRPITPPAWDDPVWEDDDLTLDDLRSRGNWRFKFGAALAGPAIVYALGLFISFFVMGLGAVDGVYWSTITMTTVGYGDLSASTWPQELVLILYLPMAVAALADSIGVMQTLATTKKLCMTDFASRADVLLLGEAGGADPNPDETLTEAEFLISVLKEEGLVDEMTITAIRLQFQHITRHDTGPADSKVLNDKVLFAELRSQGRIAQRGGGAPPVTAAGYKVDRVDLSAADGGFAEWKQAYWLPRIYDGETHGIGYIRLDPTRASSSAPPGQGGGAKVVAPVAVRTAADDAPATPAPATPAAAAPATWVAPSVSSFSGQPKFVRLREDIEEEGIPRQRVLNNPDSPIKEMLAPRGSFSNELTTYLQWAGVVALFVLLVVFLATGTPPAAADGALAD